MIQLAACALNAKRFLNLAEFERN